MESLQTTARTLNSLCWQHQGQFFLRPLGQKSSAFLHLTVPPQSSVYSALHTCVEQKAYQSRSASSSVRQRKRALKPLVASSSQQESPTLFEASKEQQELDCVASGISVECVIRDDESIPSIATIESRTSEGSSNGASNGSLTTQEDNASLSPSTSNNPSDFLSAAANNPSNSLLVTSNNPSDDFLSATGSLLLLVSPFFFWGSSMVAMKDVLPRAGPMFVAAFRLIPAGILLVGWAASRGRPQPKTAMAWVSILAFALVDSTFFQGFLAEGLKRTSAGLGSVIIDSQPLTVAVLASLLFGEKLGPRGVLGLLLGVAGLCLLEIPWDVLSESMPAMDVLSGSLPVVDGIMLSQQQGGELATTAAVAALSDPTAVAALSDDPTAVGEWDLLESGEWWMLLAAQSMAVGTVMVRWVCKHADPIMATGWHLLLGGLPLLLLSFSQQDPALQPGGLQALSPIDWSLLLYTSVFGSAVSYGVFFFNASRGSLTQLSSLTFLTPGFAALFGFLFLGETLNEQQLVGALVTLSAIYLVNTQNQMSES